MKILLSWTYKVNKHNCVYLLLATIRTKKMKRNLILAIIGLSIFSCSNEEENQQYEFTDGEILITETNGNTIVSEDLETDEINISLSQIPQSNVEIFINSENDSEVEVLSPSINFNNGNWNIPQTVVLKGVDDDQVDSNTSTSISFSISPNTSASNYQNTNSISIEVQNTDNDIAYVDGNIIIEETDNSTIVSENQDTDELKISLSERPQSDVIIAINIQDNSEIEVISNPITFNQVNWNQEQTITIQGKDDNIVDGDISSTIEISIDPSTSSSNYQNTESTNISVINEDNEMGNILWTSDLNFNLDTYDDVDLIELNGYYYVLDEDADLFKVDKSNGNVIWEKPNITGLNHQDNPAYRAHLFKKNNDLIIIAAGITSGTGYDKFLRVSSENGSILNSVDLNILINDSIRQLNSGNFIIIVGNEIIILNETGTIIQSNTIPPFNDVNSTVNSIGGEYGFMETASSYKVLDNKCGIYFSKTGLFTIDKANLHLLDNEIYYSPYVSLGTIYSDNYISNELAIIHKKTNNNSYEFSIYNNNGDEVFSTEFEYIYRKSIGLRNNKFIVLYNNSSYTGSTTFLTEFDINGNITNNKAYDIAMGARFYKNNFIVDSDGNIVCATDLGKLVKLEY